MGSVKDLIHRNDRVYGKLYRAGTDRSFGVGAWRVKGTFSVRDLKDLIPESNIRYKPEALTMIAGRFFEHLSDRHHFIETCYIGVADHDGKITTVSELLRKGDTSSVFVTKLARTPQTYHGGVDLPTYRTALSSGALKCGVADVESIFRKGFPLGSSTFRKIFRAVDMEEQYDNSATYDKVVEGLDTIRALVTSNGLFGYTVLAEELTKAGLGTVIPNPGYVLKKTVYDTTTKFEAGGDREITPKEAQELSGLDEEGYHEWVGYILPRVSQAQITFAGERDVFNMDGKVECVAYKRQPVLTDFACTPDENRLMIHYCNDGVQYLIPSNKEIARALFTAAGVDVAIRAAKRRAQNDNVDQWKTYLPAILKEHNIDLREVTDRSVKLMEYAIAETANRILNKTVFDVPRLETYVDAFLPYASRPEIQQQ